MSDDREIFGTLDYEGACPICGLFHNELCTMEDVMNDKKGIE